MDRVLNTIDGVESKKVDIITVWTTNNIELIHPAFLRPGRTDAIIRIDEPDAAAIEKLVRVFCGDLLDKGESLRRLVSNMHKKSPAFIREVVERSKLRLLSSDLPDDELKLGVLELEVAFHEHQKERAGIEEAMNEMDLMRAAMSQMTDALAARGIRVAAA
jgi:SpoVK/Ycf46/Vps4 family AAA+-type ATPase